MTLLIDADLYLYRATAATEEEVCWDAEGESNLWSLDTDLKLAKEMYFDQMDTFKEKLHDDDLIMCLSSKNNFRKKVDPSYKGNRAKVRKPLGYLAMIDWLRHHFRTCQMETLEADDVLGILATKPENKGKAIIVSDDKDMKSVPAKLYRPMSDERFDITEAEADKAFLMQCLCGDPTDGYSGLKGFGPKSSEKLLGARPDWSLVENAFIKAGHTKEEALTQARLARILRWGDWDSENRKPILFGSKEYEKARTVHEGSVKGEGA